MIYYVTSEIYVKLLLIIERSESVLELNYSAYTLYASL